MADVEISSPAPHGPSVRLVLEGGHAILGEVPAIDVARLIEGAIRAVARSAEVIAGRAPGQVGRRGAATENATRFVLRGIEAGSVAVILGNPAVADYEAAGLELEDPRLTQMALDSTLDSLSGLDTDAYVAGGLADLANELSIGARYTSLRFELGGPEGSRRSAVLNRQARHRLSTIAKKAAEEASAALVGTLVEADFERHTARLRTSDNSVVRVNFTEDHDDEIQRALRQNAEFDGIVTFDPSTSQAIAVEMRTVRRTQQLGLDLDDSDYWDERSISELAQDQGVEPVTDLAPLVDSDATDDEIDGMFEALML